MGQPGYIALPLIITLALELWNLYDGVSIFDADGVIQPSQCFPAAAKIPELFIVAQGDGVEDYMVVDVVLIYVRCNDKSMASFCKAFG